MKSPNTHPISVTAVGRLKKEVVRRFLSGHSVNQKRTLRDHRKGR